MRVDVVDAGGVPAQRIEVEVPSTATVADALAAAGVVVPAGGVVAVGGRSRALDGALGEGERLEVCAPLRADPKQARRQRARRQRLS